MLVINLLLSLLLLKGTVYWCAFPACPGGAVDDWYSVAVRAAWLRSSASLGSRPRLAGSLCQVIAAYALRLNSRAGIEGSTVSSLICDRWQYWVQRRSVLVAAWTTGDRWPPAVCAGWSSPFSRTAAHIFVSPGDALAIIMQYVAWMEREFNACQTPRSKYMYLSIFNSFRVIRCWSQCVSPKIVIFTTFLFSLGAPLGQ